MKGKFGIRQILLIILLAVVVLIPAVIDTPYILGICVTTFYTACCTLAWSVLGGLTGQNSLGHAGFMGIGAYIGAILLNNLHVSPWVSMIIAFLVVGLIAACLLTPCFVLSGPYFTLVTIAMAEAFRNLFTNWNFAGGGQGILVPMKEKGFYTIRWLSKVPYYYIALIMLIVFYLVLVRIDRSKLGYALKTIREDEDTANAVGINPRRYKFIATFISAGMIAIVGVFYACYIGYINPDILKQSQSLSFVMPAIIGGVGSITGPLVGALVLTPLSEFLSSSLSSIASGLNLIVYAAIAIIVILFQPSGIMGWYDHSKLKARIDARLDAIDSKIFKRKEE